MKAKLLVLLTLLYLASAKSIPAEILGTPTFSGCNCRSDNTPNPIEVAFSVQNPSSRTLQLSYEWYDYSTNAFKKGDKVVCSSGSTTLAPSGYDSCKVYLYTMRGGLNGSAKTTFRLIGQDGMDEYTKSFEVLIEYHTSPYEVNIISRLEAVEYDFQQLNSELQKYCYKDTCCGMVKVYGFMGLAGLNLSEANGSLRACQLSSAWDYMTNASNSIHSANESLLPLRGNCSTALSLINTTGLRIASVANVISEGKKCGANVTLSESNLADANSSLEEAKQDVYKDGYLLAFSKLSSANNSILAAVTSIGQCAQNKPQKPNASLPSGNATNQSSNQTSSDSGTLLLLGGAFAAVILAVVIVAAVLFARSRPRKQTPPTMLSAKPPLPPAPPATPEIHEDLEKEFNEWLDSHSKK